MKIIGSLVFDQSSLSEIKNLRLQKYEGASVPTYVTSDRGRVIYVTTAGGGYAANTLYLGTPTGWVAIATGGNAAAIQTEIDNLQAALGSMISPSGTFVPGQVTINGVPSNASTTTGVLQELSNAISNKDSLSELIDVDIALPLDNQFLRYETSSTSWVNHTITTGDISDITATASEINILDGATLSTIELNFVDGVTSNIQTQLDGKQPVASALTGLSLLNSTGMLVQTGIGVNPSFTHRQLVAPATGFTISNPNGVPGNPTFALADDLAALEGLSTTGYVVRTGDGTATTRAIAGTANRIVVANGDGVTSSTTLDLATVTNPGTAGSFLKITTDAYGRVSNSIAVAASDITSLVNSVYVNATGDSLTGSLDFGGTSTVTGLRAPLADNDAATKIYVDTVAEGLRTKPAAEIVVIANLVATYDNGASGVGATLTGTGPFPTIDGITLTSIVDGANGVLVAGQTDPTQNGRYNLTAVNPWVLTRCALCNEADEIPGSYTFIKRGNLYAGSGWVLTVDDPTTFQVGVNPIFVAQFSGAGSYTAGSGLALSGSQFSVRMGAGIVDLPTGEVGIHLSTPTSGGLRLRSGGSDSTVAGATLELITGAGLTQDASGLYVGAGQVSNSMLANSTISIDADAGGADSISLGETLLISGSSVQGISTSRSANNTITVSAANASSSQKGVASFVSPTFTVSSGSVNIAPDGVTNAMIANESITVAGTSGSDAVALGETLAIRGTVNGIVTTTAASNAVEITVRDATVSLKGVASFADADFTVTAGAVTIDAKPLDWLTDVAVSTPAVGQTLVYNGTNFVNRKIYHTQAFSVSSTWVVVHNIGQKYCNVMVIDSTDEAVIPQSIVFNSTTQLTVTFNTPIAGQVVVMGVNTSA